MLSLVNLAEEDLGIGQETIQGFTAVIIHSSRRVMSQMPREIGLRLIRKHIAVLVCHRVAFGQDQLFVLRSRPILLTLPFWSIQLASPIVLLDLWLTGSKFNHYLQSG